MSEVQTLHLDLSHLLLKSQVITQQQLKHVITSANNNQWTFIQSLIHNQIISSYSLAQFIHHEFGMPLVDLNDYDLTSIPSTYINFELIALHRCLPLFTRGDCLYIAQSDPTHQQAIKDFQLTLAIKVEAMLVEQDKLDAAITRVLKKRNHASKANQLSWKVTSNPLVSSTGKSNTDDDSIISYINHVLTDAVKCGASDLHFEPYENTYRIRFRIDGVLQEIARPPAHLVSRIAARLKVMSKLDITDRRIPQDGRVTFTSSQDVHIDFRISTLPTLWGEKIVMRIVESNSTPRQIGQLGFEPDQQALFTDALALSQGMILVTGPTGSGKTVSLYTGLARLNTNERNIATAEDPVEIYLKGVNQLQINAKIGLTFATALRAFLRQDPDVVMVGEIRDTETAEVAIKASQTGHLVLSTLHTNSASETVTRLSNMGIAAYNIASSVSLIVAQRLVRRLCEHCKTTEDIPDTQLMQLGFSQEQVTTGFTTYKPVGCPYCSSGFKGRIGIYEVMRMTDELASVILDTNNPLLLLDAAKKQGMRTLREAGLLKVIHGICSINEINRVTGFG